MTNIDKLKRIMWRAAKNKVWTRSKFDIFIFYEVGSDKRTLKHVYETLKKLNWIKCRSRLVEITGEHENASTG